MAAPLAPLVLQPFEAMLQEDLHGLTIGGGGETARSCMHASAQRPRPHAPRPAGVRALGVHTRGRGGRGRAGPRRLRAPGGPGAKRPIDTRVTAPFPPLHEGAAAHADDGKEEEQQAGAPARNAGNVMGGVWHRRCPPSNGRAAAVAVCARAVAGRLAASGLHPRRVRGSAARAAAAPGPVAPPPAGERALSATQTAGFCVQFAWGPARGVVGPRRPLAGEDLTIAAPAL